MAAGSLFWQPAPQSPQPQFFCCVKPGQPARAGARSGASRSHTNIRRPGGRRHGVAEASTVAAAATAAAARLPASAEVLMGVTCRRGPYAYWLGALAGAAESPITVTTPPLRCFGGAEASTVAAADAAAAAALPVSEVKSSPASSVLAAATARPLRSASARSIGFWPTASPACRASQRGCARAREGTRTPSRRDAITRACISCG